MRSGWRLASAPMRASCAPAPSRPSVAAEFAVADNHPALRSCARPGSRTDLAGTIVLRRLVARRRPQPRLCQRRAGQRRAAARTRRHAGRDPGPGRAARPVGPGDASRPARRVRRPHGRPRPRWPRPGANGGRRASGPPRRRACWPKAVPRRTCCGIITPKSRRWRPRATRRSGSAPAARCCRTRSGSARRLARRSARSRARPVRSGRWRARLRRLERARDRAQGLLDGAVAAAERAAQETAEALAALTAAGHALELDPRALEEVEERLFAVRALARKHSVAVADLPALARSNRANGWPRSKAAPKASPRLKRKRPRRAPAISPPPGPFQRRASAPPAGSMPRSRPSWRRCGSTRRGSAPC